MKRIKKPSEIRVGTLLGPHDPFWVQVREAVYEAVQRRGMTLVPLELFESPQMLVTQDTAGIADELLAENLDVLISQEIPFQIVQQMLENGLPVIYLSESEKRHPLYVSLQGLEQASRMVGEYVAKALKGRGRALCVGGLLETGEDKGISRIRGFVDSLRKYPDIAVMHYPAYWRYEDALPLIESSLKALDTPPDAIFGISDSLALSGRDAAQALGLLTPETVVIGINGDPLALAAIDDGTMNATIETSAAAMANQAVDIALRAATGQSFANTYHHHLRLITKENVAEVALEKLKAIARIPSRLVGVNFQQEQTRLRHLQTSAEINQRLGTLLDRRQLAGEIAELLRENYQYDLVQIFLWNEAEGVLIQEMDGACRESRVIPVGEAGILGEAIQKREPVYIPDTRFSQRYPPDPCWPETRTRVALPILFGEKVFGVVDLHQYRPNPNVREDIFGMRPLADYLGIVFRNAELFTDALASRETAENANQLKTRLLANVSHELRTPLNIILGYSQSALATPNPYQVELPEGLRQDLLYIFQSGMHLQRIVSDLLDLSRAEIGELELVPEVIDTRNFLVDTFTNIASQASISADVKKVLELPPRLPMIQADPVRLRQIILNLLSNAFKFTDHGEVCLGAGVEPPYLHLWVRDSGLGIPLEVQERIFEPFRTVNLSTWRQREGIGLGLNITRQLVLLHGGSMLLESQPGRGSTFHVYLPLPNLSGSLPSLLEPGGRPVLAVISAQESLPAELLEICQRQNLEAYRLSPSQNLGEVWKSIQPVGLAWDLTGANVGDWSLVQSLRGQAQFSRLPFLLYSQDGCQLSGVLTSIVYKPLNRKSLAEYLDGMMPRGMHGPVWIVDDDPHARQLYQRLVEQAFPGKTLRVAEDGEQALNFLKEEAPGLVILDLLMPGVDGFQFLERLRRNQATCRVPVVVISGKLLTLEDIERLNYGQVALQTKDILSDAEAINFLQQTHMDLQGLRQPTSLLVKQSLAYLHQNFENNLSRHELAQAVGVSDNYLSQIFHHEIGITPWEYLNRLRILRAKEYLLNGEQSVTEVACRVGFNDPAYFSRVFKKLLGVSPQVYRGRLKGQV